VSGETLGLLTIPLFSGVLGYITNWTGIWMLFYPVRFKGFKVPGLAALVSLAPRKVQQVPGFMHGAAGWQGIIPSRAAKMGSIAVDKGIAKLGSPQEFFEQLDPEAMAEHVVESARPDMREVVERIMEREHPQLWRDLPPQLRERVHERVQRQLPAIVDDVIGEIGENVDQLLDVKLMVIRRIEEHPELGNRIFLEVGRKELRLIIRLGFVFGFLFGILLIPIVALVHQWWVLIVGAVVIGWVTNWLAILMIFEPYEPRKIGPITLQGLFLRRQKEVSDVYSRLIADEIVTMRNMGEELMKGPRSDRTRAMIEESLRGAVDNAVGPIRPAVRVAMGTREYDTIRESVAVEAADYTMTPLRDESFDRKQSDRIRELIRDRMRELPSRDFAELLRSGMREDEWLLLAHGGVLGFVAGGIHLLIFPI
jgi:uncharacterized membrane protein YheB (UPF0754 family)